MNIFDCSLPYVRATILEIHRRSVVVPLLPHKVYRDVEFQGYHIPKVFRSGRLHQLSCDDMK